MEISTNMIGANPFKTRRRKFGVFSLLILLALGAAFVGVGLVIHNSLKIDPSWTRISGTVTGVSTSNSSNGGGTTYTPIISYRVNGQTYQISGSNGSSAYPATGSSRQIAYDPNNPGHAKAVSSGSVQTFVLLFPAIGVMLLIVGPISFVKSLKRTEDINGLKQTGQKLQGVITDIQSNNSNQGGANYRLLVAATTPNGQVQNYTSDWVSGIGGLAMADFRSHPIPIDVYINPSNPQDYYVDISEVPNLTPDRIAELIKSAAQSQSIVPPTSPPPQTPTTTPPATTPTPPAQTPPTA